MVIDKLIYHILALEMYDFVFDKLSYVLIRFVGKLSINIAIIVI